MVKAEQVCKSFGALEVLKGITLEVGKGEVLVPGRPVRVGQVDVPALYQPSGAGQCGPAACRRRIDRLPRRQVPSCIEISPRDAAKQRRDIGMVFQHFNLFPHRTALENIIEAPIHVKGVKKDEAVARGRGSAGPGRAGG